MLIGAVSSDVLASGYLCSFLVHQVNAPVVSVVMRDEFVAHFRAMVDHPSPHPWNPRGRLVVGSCHLST
ncbi:hypothetical protein R1flu_008850 [Riccia fluitans]|uniref:Uncharacterized protein n=1 Tax=Riccia fluitans TaxID=41844 RepID=A0ABD1Z0D7_9MARC